MLFNIVLLAALAAPIGTAGAAEQINFDEKLNQIREKINSQIEQVRGAREKADNQMELARLRAAEQLRSSEENLILQVEMLDRLREQLQEQMAETKQAIDKMRRDRILTIGKTLMDIEAQINQTTGVVERMRILREGMDKEEAGGGAQQGILSSLAGSTANLPDNASGTAQGSCPFLPQPFPEAPATYPGTSPAGPGYPGTR